MRGGSRCACPRRRGCCFTTSSTASTSLNRSRLPTALCPAISRQRGTRDGRVRLWAWGGIGREKCAELTGDSYRGQIMPRLDAGSAGRGASTPLSSAAASHLHALCSQMMITMGESIVGLTVYNLKQAGPEPPPRTSVQMSVLSDPVRRPKRASTVTLREHRPLI